MQLRTPVISVSLVDLKQGICRYVVMYNPRATPSSYPYKNRKQTLTKHASTQWPHLPDTEDGDDGFYTNDVDCDCEECDEWVINVRPGKPSAPCQRDLLREELQRREEEDRYRTPTVPCTPSLWQKVAMELYAESSRIRQSEACVHGVLPSFQKTTSYATELAKWHQKVPWNERPTDFSNIDEGYESEAESDESWGGTTCFRAWWSV